MDERREDPTDRRWWKRGLWGAACLVAAAGITVWAAGPSASAGAGGLGRTGTGAGSAGEPGPGGLRAALNAGAFRLGAFCSLLVGLLVFAQLAGARTAANPSLDVTFAVDNVADRAAVSYRFTNQYGGETTQAYYPPREYIVGVGYRF